MINKNTVFYELAKDKLSYNKDTGSFSNPNSTRKIGSCDVHGYFRFGVNSKKHGFKIVKAHRLAWYITYGYIPNIIDHIDGDKLNNKISNLRECTNKQNTQNKKLMKTNTSGYTGVCWHKQNKNWVAVLQKKHLGSFNCPKEAYEKYKSEAIKLYGEFYNEKEA